MQVTQSLRCAAAVPAAAMAPPVNLDVIQVPVGGDLKDCGLTGTAKSVEGKRLDKLKNRYHAPAPADIDRFDESKGARLTGLVIDVKVGGVETWNCRTTNPDYRDSHIKLAHES
jgi:hypothetical protein